MTGSGAGGAVFLVCVVGKVLLWPGGGGGLSHRVGGILVGRGGGLGSFSYRHL